LRALLIYPGLVEGFGSYYRGGDWFNHGLGIISSLLKLHGHAVEYLDLRKMQGWGEVANRIADTDFDIAMISLATVDFEAAKTIAQLIKAKDRHLKVMVGGPHPTLRTEQTAEVEEFDYVFTHEAEITLPQVLAGLPGVPRLIKGEMPTNLDALPFVDRSLAPDGETPWFSGFARPYFAVTASRGCLYNCAFCQPAERAVFGNRVRKRSVDNILSEVEHLVTEYGMKSFLIHDDCFTQFDTWVEEFCAKKRERGLTEPFACQSRADTICKRPDLMEKLTRAGLRWVLIGFESGSDRVLKYLRKGTTVQQNWRAAQICKDLGIRIFANYMFGIPTETNEEMRQTALMIQAIQPDHCSPATFTPAPGSDLYEHCAKNDLILIDSSEGYRRSVGSGAKIKGVDYAYVDQMVALSMQRPMAGVVERPSREAQGDNGPRRLPKVSILIPTYDRPQFFEKALLSALAQTYPNIEIVVCDNSRNEATQKLIEPYLAKFSLLKYFHNSTNLGMVGNFRECIKHATGEYVNYLMDDDLFQERKIERMMAQFLSRDDVSLVTSARQLIDAEGNPRPPEAHNAPLFARDTVIDGIALGDLVLSRLLNQIGEPTTVLFRKADLDEPFGRFLGRDYGCNSDLASWLKLLAKGKAVYLAEPLSFMRIHEKQLQQSVKMRTLGLADWAHQIVFARKLGFLTKDADFLAAAFRCLRGIADVVELGAKTSDHDWIVGSGLKESAPELLRELIASLETRSRASRAGDVEGAAGPLVSIIIATFNKWEYTAKCLEKLAENTRGVPFELIMVDNASTDGTRTALSQLAGSCRVHLNETNAGFAKACNQGARMARGKYLLFLNNDTEPQPGWLEAMVKVAEADPTISVVGSKLLFPDGTIQHGGVGLVYASPYPITAVHLHYRWPAEAGSRMLAPQAVTAACMLVRSEVFRDVGGFDESYLNGYEDVDFCLKVGEKGGRIVYTPESVVIHHESVSEGRHLKENANLDLLHRRWLGRFTTFDKNAFAEARASAADPQRPGVSIVVVTYNSLATVAPCLESLALHTAPQDEIILVDNGSHDATMQFVELFQAKHPGLIQVIRSQKNLGFSRGTNLGLQTATKDYVVLLNPDVQVTPNWLDRLLAHLMADPAVGAAGPTSSYVAGLQKVTHYLKMDDPVDPDGISAALKERYQGRTVETQLLIGFCLLTRRQLLQDLGGLDPDLFLGNDDLDFSWQLRQRGYRLLVALDVFVKHFGQVSFKTESGLKTKYLVAQSTNLLFEKLYAHYDGQVPGAPELWGMSWFKPQTGLVSIVVLLHNNLEVTRQCINKLYEHTRRDFELLLVDNGSTEDVPSFAAELQRLRGNVVYLRNEENGGYAYGCNQGLAVARGEYVVLLNNDVVVTPGWLSKQLALLSLDSSLGMVGPRTNFSAGVQQIASVPYQDLDGMERFADEWFVEHAGEIGLTSRITGVCMVLRRDVLNKIGGFDTCFGTGNFEDDDFCLRVTRAGFHIAIANDVFVHHYGSSTFKALKLDYRRLLEENWRFFCHKWQHRGALKDGYQAADLAKTRPCDPEWDFVPLRYEEVFHPKAEPLALAAPRPVRFLCVPAWSNSAWREVIGHYLKAFSASDPVSLVIRVEPPDSELVEEATRAVRQLLAESGLPEALTPDLVLETSVIPARRRGGLYTAATAFLPCAGSRAALYAREARACGLPVVEDLSPEALQRVAQEVLARTGEHEAATA
jgi:GT2 family glycosyltransferase/radical SAM superfamily enzyme YgiQ (UPF0313 family)